MESQPAPVEETVRRRPVLRDAAAFSRRRLVPAALMCSLLANGLFVAHVLARKGEEATQVAVRMVTLTESVAEAPSTSRPQTRDQERSAAPKVAAAPSPRTATKGAVERKVVSLLLSAPARRLPRDFVDPVTGLVKNNVQVVCRNAKQRSFLCAVRLSPANASKALYIRYRTSKTGRGVFKWYGYRRS